MTFNSSSNRSCKPITSRFYQRTHFWCSRYLLACLMLFSISAVAETTDSTYPVTLDEAIQMTLQNHPEMSRYQYQKQRFDGLVKQASVGQKPKLDVTIEDAFGSGDYSGFDIAQTTIGITWILDGDLIDGRVKASKQAASQVNFERDIQALDLSANTAKIFIEHVALQEQIKLARLNLKQTEEAYQSIVSRNQKGKGSTIDTIQMKANVARAELMIEDLEHELKASQRRFLNQVGEQSRLLTPKGNLFSIPDINSFDESLVKLKQHPRLSSFANKSRVLESQIELARIEAEPKWEISTGVRRYERTSDVGIVAGFSVPLGSSSSNAGKIQSLRAEQSIYQVEAEVLKRELNTQLYVLLQEIEHSKHVIDVNQETIIPLLKEAKEEVNKAYEIGRTSYLQWFNIHQDYLAAHLNLISTYKTLHLQNIELQRLTGTSLETLEN
ncbi:outer membrane efflux protein [Kangiella koreensis DSM 16069]|uniref:Outer membrane efflux protein n=2 Tax=Kangiella TaxID=261963 RepID=C7RBQ1_KANKD|nr:outer membrane efflux protein [Kangiella koreensis DSM 16069]